MALGTMGILGLASAAGGVAQGMAASKAAKSQAAAADKADETQRYIFDQQVALTEPQRNIGNNALAALAFESGLGPRPSTGGNGPMQITQTGSGPTYSTEAIYAQGGRGEGEQTGTRQVANENPMQFSVNGQSFDTREDAQGYINSQPQNAFDYTPLNKPDADLNFSVGEFEASPGYQFRLDEGNKAMERMASARGMRFSGAAAKDAMRFGQGIGSQEYGNFYGREMDRYGRETDQFNRSYGVYQDQMNAMRGLAGTGQSATQAQISAGNNYASGVNANAFNRGNAQAQGAIGVGNAFAGGINNMSNIYGMANSGYLGQNPGLGIKPAFNPFGGAS